MRNCRSCAGPLPDGAEYCAHCGTKVEPEFSWTAFAKRVRDAQNPSTLNCPRCRTAMILSRYGPLAVDECGSCKGIWFDREELDPMIRRFREEKQSALGPEAMRRTRQAKIDQPGSAYLQCPRCGDLMSRFNYAQRSGVLVDRCTEDGVWIDAGEFEKIVEFLGDQPPPILPKPGPRVTRADLIPDPGRATTLCEFFEWLFDEP